MDRADGMTTVWENAGAMMLSWVRIKLYRAFCPKISSFAFIFT